MSWSLGLGWLQVPTLRKTRKDYLWSAAETSTSDLYV